MKTFYSTGEPKKTINKNVIHFSDDMHGKFKKRNIK